MSDFHAILGRQRLFFSSDQTKFLSFRLRQLEQLRDTICDFEPRIVEALQKDLNKSEFESFETEIGLVYSELSYTLRHLHTWARPKAARPSILHFPASGRVYAEPYGSVLILSPWNYPFQLAMVPLIGAIAAGNCVVLKPSAYSPATSAVIAELLGKCFSPEYVAVVQGGRAENAGLLQEPFDYIFFTGSPAVGKVVMSAAAEHLTPVTLELGGKSPCIVDETADIPLAATRIAWGKLLNAGQTCIAPDYLLVHKDVKEQLLVELEKNIRAFYGEHPEQSEIFPKIISDKHLTRLRGYLQDGTIRFGGQINEKTRQMAPTVLENVSWESPVMQEEIFGPIFPVLTFDNLEEVLPIVRARPKPLALYLFTRSKAHERRVLGQLSFGGGCVNDTIIHIANTSMAFGGVGSSGMGRYHGKASFDTFTHRKPVVKKANWLDIRLRYPPFGGRVKLLRHLMK